MPLSNKEKCFLEIGKIVTRFNLLEQSIMIFIISVGEIDPLVGLSMLSGESFDTLLKMLDAVVRAKIKDGVKIKHFEKIRSRISTVNDDRNKYLHSIWKGDSEIIAAKFPKKKLGHTLKYNLTPVDLNGLQHYSDEVWKSLVDLLTFVVEN